MCDFVKKSEGGPCFFFREGGAFGMGGPLAWGGGVGREGGSMEVHQSNESKGRNTWQDGNQHHSNTTPQPRINFFLILTNTTAKFHGSKYCGPNTSHCLAGSHDPPCPQDTGTV